MKVHRIARLCGLSVLVSAAICACSGNGTSGGGLGYVAGNAATRGASMVAGAGSGSEQQALSRTRDISPGKCGSTPGPGSFKGGSGAGTAAGRDSGLLAGFDNGACDTESAVVTGALNFVSSGIGSGAQFSLIGGGETNTIAGSNSPFSIIGAGTGNGISGYAAMIGAGQNNTISGGTGTQYSMIGAGLSNTIGGTSAGSSFIGAGNTNAISGFYDVIGGGYVNQNQGNYSFIGSGNHNSIESGPPGEPDDVIAGGNANTIDDAQISVVAGGGSNTISLASYAFIGGGLGNTISGEYGTIGGGEGDSVTAEYGSVGGGYGDLAEGNYATVGGGGRNLASGADATVPGGGGNAASGFASFAAGYFADASQSGSFVWSDASTTTQTKATVANQFVARASGGYTLFSNSAMTSGVALAAGSGSWASLSDRGAKANFEPISDDAILNRVASLPIGTWSYKSERGVRHVGPMAQDFYAAFGVGEDDRHITSIDEDGIALAAIKALRRENRLLQAQLTQKGVQLRTLRGQVGRLAADDGDVATLEREVARLSAEVAALSSRATR